MAANGHAKFSASGAHRWLRCAASIEMCEAVGRHTQSTYAQDGTEAHQLLEHCVKNKTYDAQLGYQTGLFPDWKVVGRELAGRIDAVQVALDYVRNLFILFPDGEVFAERFLPFKLRSSPADVDAGGTCDVVFIVRSINLIIVIDYKHGVGEEVTVQNNEQVLMYVTCALQEHGHFDHVLGVVIQPRYKAGRVISQWNIPKETLEAYECQVEEAILTYDARKHEFNPGDKQCRWCEAAAVCKANEGRRASKLGPVFNTFVNIGSKLPNLQELDYNRLADLLDARAPIKAFFAELDKLALGLARAGRAIPRYKLVEADGKRSYDAETEQEMEQTAEYLLSRVPGLSKDTIYPRKLVGIGEMEAMIRAVLKDKVEDHHAEARKLMADVCTKDNNGVTVVVPDTDKRPAYNPAEVMFAAITLPAKG